MGRPPRPIKSCTNCRQQKIRCNAAQTYPEPCSRCAKYDRACTVDPLFRPRRGGQIELLREDIKRLEQEMKVLKQPDSTEVPARSRSVTPLDTPDASTASGPSAKRLRVDRNHHVAGPHQHHHHQQQQQHYDESSGQHHSYGNGDHPTPIVPASASPMLSETSGVGHHSDAAPLADDSPPSVVIVPTEGPYHLEQIVLSSADAERLHSVFMESYWPFIPIFESDSAGALYTQSETLFWTVMCVASMSEPEPDLYSSLVEPLKRLVMKVCWVETPRSTHIVQALLILCTWPLPNEKVLDDFSHRYTSLARSLGLQLGMHRGKFIYEFSRKQKLMPNAVKWRTRTWLYIYISEQFLSASLGVPSNMPSDYIIENSPHQHEMRLSDSSRSILKLATFYSKTVSIMGSSVSTPDGLMDAKSRGPMLDILCNDLKELLKPHEIENDKFVEIVSLYIQCILSCFAFLPDTPEQDQSRFIVDAFHAATRLVTIMRNFVGKRRILEFPSVVRQASSFAALLLFRLHLLPQFPKQFVESARESVVTVHHLYRNVPPAWASVPNDITRIAKILESLNYVLITHPYLLESRQIMKRMRSHLTFSLFYELLWSVHEARRRNTRAKEKERKELGENVPQPLIGPERPSTESLQNTSVRPLPLFSQISSDAYTSSTVVSPNGTTLTKLLPTAGADSHGASIEPGDVVVMPPPRGNGAPAIAAEHVSTSIEHPPLPAFKKSGSSTPVTGNGTMTRHTSSEPNGPLAYDQLLQGFDWMDYEGDDFLGWMPNAEFGL